MAGLLSRLDKELDSTAKQLRQEEEVAEQAERIRLASERKRPGEEIDAELKELIVKWRLVSRLAATRSLGW